MRFLHFHKKEEEKQYTLSYIRRRFLDRDEYQRFMLWAMNNQELQVNLSGQRNEHYTIRESALERYSQWKEKQKILEIKVNCVDII